MKTLNITPAEFNKKVKLGYFDIIKQLSVFVFEVKNNLCGRSEIIKVNIKNW